MTLLLTSLKRQAQYRVDLQQELLQHEVIVHGVPIAEGKAVRILARPLAKPIDEEHMHAVCERLYNFHSPFVERLIDYGLDSDEGFAYFVYEKCEGVQLDAALDGKRPLTESQALGITCDAIRGLVELNKAGLIHGNIRLGNFILKPDKQFVMMAPVPMDLDQYGPPKEVFAPSELIYVAPERLQDVPCNNLVSDLYAIGVVLYTLLCMDPLVSASNEQEFVSNIVNGKLRELKKALPYSSRGMQDILNCCLSADSTRRYPSLHDLRHDLNMVLADEDADRAGAMMSSMLPAGGASAATSLAIEVQDIKTYLDDQRQSATRPETISGPSTKPDRPPSGKMVVDERLKRLSKLIRVADNAMKAWIKLAPNVRFPENLLRQTLGCEEVVHGIREAGILQATTPSNKIRRIVLAEGTAPGPGRAGMNVLGAMLNPLQVAMLVTVSDDRMSATAVVAPGKVPTYDDIEAALKKAGVRVGVDRAVVDSLVDLGCPDGEIVIAKGIKPKDGLPSRFVLDEMCEGMQTIEAGDRVAYWAPPEPSADGSDVYGAAMRANMPEELELDMLVGPGVECVKEAGRTYLVAKMAGVASISDVGIVRVREVERIPGDLGPDQQISSDSMVIVEGDILPGVTIDVSADLIVHGSVHDAKVLVGGNLIIDGEILPGEQEISACGQVKAQRIRSRHVVGDQVIVAEDIVDGDVIATNEIRAEHVAGGRLTAAKSFTINSIGDDNETETMLWAGYHVPKAVQRDLAKVKERRVGQEREMMLKEQAVFKRIVNEISQKNYMQHVNGFMRKDYKDDMYKREERIRKRIAALADTLEGHREELQSKRNDINDLSEDVENYNGEVVVTGTIHAGVKIKIADAGTRRIEKKQEEVTLKL